MNIDSIRFSNRSAPLTPDHPVKDGHCEACIRALARSADSGTTSRVAALAATSVTPADAGKSVGVDEVTLSPAARAAALRTTEDAVRDRSETTDLERVLEVEDRDPGFAAARQRRRSPGEDPLEGASVPVRQAARDLGALADRVDRGEVTEDELDRFLARLQPVVRAELREVVEDLESQASSSLGQTIDEVV
jgi:hypothetical protein